MKDRYDLLVFDWDGTLYDSVGWIVECLKHAAIASGVTAPSDRHARSIIGISLDQAMQVLYPQSGPELAQRILGHYRAHFYSRHRPSVGLFEGVETMLADFRSQGYRLAVATGKSRSGLDLALQQTGIGHLFHATRCAEETASKPDPRMLYELFEELAVTPERALLVGDTVHDLMMAANAGIDAIAVTCGANTLDELAELNPLMTIEWPAELFTFLQR